MGDLEIAIVDGDVHRRQAAGVFPGHVGAGEKAFLDRFHVASAYSPEQGLGFRGYFGGGGGTPGNAQAEAKSNCKNAETIITLEKSRQTPQDRKSPR